MEGKSGLQGEETAGLMRTCPVRLPLNKNQVFPGYLELYLEYQENNDLISKNGPMSVEHERF